ncbi:magnesium transporter MgtC, partial [Stenotrophomonas maltophilia]
MTNSLWGVWGDVNSHLLRMTLTFLFT